MLSPEEELMDMYSFPSGSTSQSRFQEWDGQQEDFEYRTTTATAAGPPPQLAPAPPSVKRTVSELEGGDVHRENTAVKVRIAGGATQDMVKVADKSCARCRTRKVKCGRQWPICGRCEKRKESCEYKEDVNFTFQPIWHPTSAFNTNQNSPATTQDSEDDYTRPLPYQTVRPSYDTIYRPPPNAPPPPLSSRPQYDTSSRTLSYPPTVNYTTINDYNDHNYGHNNSNGSGSNSVNNLPPNMSRLWDQFLRESSIGEQSVDWQLAKPAMASSLTLHLLEASTQSCCFHLPAFHLFAGRMEYLKEHLDTLDIPSQVAVAVLASLGARGSPHSALLGVTGPDIENANAPHELVLTAGTRRENAWQAIAERAVKLASRMDILQVPTKANVESLVAMIQMLMLAESKPVRSRFFIRNAFGLFQDLQRSNMTTEEIQRIKVAVGATLYESDARTSAFLRQPLIISDDDVYEYFDETGVIVPDLDRDTLADALDAIVDPALGPITRAKLDSALSTTGYWVCAIQRKFAHLASARRARIDYLNQFPLLWSYIDSAHSAVQRLHRRLVGLEKNDDLNRGDHSVEYDLLIGVRMDTRLIDVVNLAHGFLLNQLDKNLTSTERTGLEEVIGMSERRVRKCLKLLSFYAKVFVDSPDKHLVYHLVVQLDALPTWALMVVQRTGELTGSGPLMPECELSERELDWFEAGLELACFYTPLAATRLRQLTEGRRTRRQRSAEADFDYSLVPTSMAPSLPSSISVSTPMPAFTSSIYAPLPSPSPQTTHRPAPSPVGLPEPSPPTYPSSGLSPYTFTSYGTPSYPTSQQLGPSPGGSGAPGGGGGGAEQQMWLEGLDFDAMLNGAGSGAGGSGGVNGGSPEEGVGGVGGAGAQGTSSGGQQSTTSTSNGSSSTYSTGQGGLRPFEEGGRWTGMSQW